MVKSSLGVDATNVGSITAGVLRSPIDENGVSAMTVDLTNKRIVFDDRHVGEPFPVLEFTDEQLEERQRSEYSDYY